MTSDLSDAVSLRLSWASPAARPTGAAGPALVPCAGSRLRYLPVGYMRLQTSDPPGLTDLLTADMRAFPHRSGLALPDTHTEQPDEASSRQGAAFSQLVKALRRPHLPAIVIPSPEHFSRFGGMSPVMYTIIKIETGTDVLAMSDSDEGMR
jgi:hypothetical protein